MVFDYFKKKIGGDKKPSRDGNRAAAVQPAVTDLPAPAAPVTIGEPARKPGKPASPEVPPEKIAQRAYEIWVRKGRPAGTADQDWLQAEAELRAERPDPGLPNKPR
jgi:hypothetical protein